jgi:RimJ/RimL family protein N-acetyltransferase
MMTGRITLQLLRSLHGEHRERVIRAASRISIPEAQQRFSGTVQELIDLDAREPERHVFLMKKDADIVGIGSLVTGPVPTDLWPMPGRVVQLLGFIVDESLQGQGIGSAAAHACIDLARTIDPEAEYLQLTVNLRNPGARHVYEKAGFVTHDELYLGGPAGPQYIMYRALRQVSAR